MLSRPLSLWHYTYSHVDIWYFVLIFWIKISSLQMYKSVCSASYHIQYIPRNMHTVFALLCFVVVIHWLIFPYPSGLLHWHCGNLTIAPVPAKQPWWIWINTSCENIMNACVTTTKQSTTKPCEYFLGYTVGEAAFFYIANRLKLWENPKKPYVCMLVHSVAYLF